MQYKTVDFFFLATITIGFLSCNSAKVSTHKTADVDLSKYNTFAYLPMLSDTSREDYNFLAESQFMDQIGEEMRDIGYTVDTESPDLLVYTQTQFQ